MSYFYENYRQQRVTPPNIPWAYTSRHPPPVQPTHAYQTISQKIFYQRHLSYGGCPQGHFAPRPQYWNPYMAATQQRSFTCRTAGFCPGPTSAEYSGYARAYYPTPPQYFSPPPPVPVTIRPMQRHTLPPQVLRVQSCSTPRAESKQPPSPCLIRIRDPNQGGRDITEEIMSGVRWSTAAFTPTPPPQEQVDKLASEADDETRAENDNEQNRERDTAQAAPECDLASEHPAEPPLKHPAELLAEFANETWAEYEVKQTPESDTLKAALVCEHDSGPCFTLAEPFLKLPAEPLTELSTESPSAVKVRGMQSRDGQYTELDGPEAAPPHKPAPELMFKSLAEVAHAIMAGNEDEPNTETDWDEGAPAHQSGPLSTKAVPIEEPSPESTTEPSAEVADKTRKEMWDKQTREKYRDESASAPAGKKMPPDLGERKRCDVGFLPSLKNGTCAQKPKGLPRISRVVNETRPKRADRAGSLNAAPDFLPRYMKNLGSKPGEGSKPLASSLKDGTHTFHPNGTQKDATKEPRKFTPAVSIDNKVQLSKAEHAWRPSPRKSARGRGGQEATDDDPEQVKTQQLFKRLRSILNKLTPQKFDKLLKQVKELTIDTNERLKGAIDLIFEKAISEPNFSVAYASMCSYLTKLNNLSADKRGVNVKFHKVLLNRCQEEFERDRDDDEMLKKKQKGLEAAEDDDERERLTLELEEARYKARRCSIGNMKFIGELFKLNIITASIMDGCIQKLLRNGDEESLECLSTLLSTTGKNLDNKDGKPCMDKNFHQIETIIKERKTSTRIRFMLQDLVDLRKNKWVPRREDQGPKTMDQIHKEAKMEELMVHQQLLAMEEEENIMGKSVRGRGCLTPDDPRTRQAHTVGWNTKNRPINIALLRATLAQDVNTLELVPGGKRDRMCRWDKGCSGGQEEKGCGQCKTSSFNQFPDSDDKVTQRSSSNQKYGDGRERTGRCRNWLGGFDRDTHNSTEPRRHDASTAREPDGKGWDPGSEDYPPLVDLTVKPRRPPASTCPPKPTLSVEEVESKSTAIISEYLCWNNLEDALQRVTELQSASLLSVFVRHTVESALDRSSIERERIGLLLQHLVKAGTLPAQQYYKGLEETLKAAEDIAIDVPHIWRYLAEIITPMLCEGGIPVGQLFREITKPLMQLGKAGILLAEILKLRRKEMSPEKVGDMWTDAGMRRSHFLPQDWGKNQPIVTKVIDTLLMPTSESEIHPRR